MLHRAFALNGDADIIVLFVVDEAFEIVGFRKAFHDAFAVLEDTADNIVCDADVKSAVGTVTENVDVAPLPMAYSNKAWMAGT